MMLDHDQCYRAIESRDARFDGWFVTAVRTTGIYCRPSCPAITPKRTNVEFFVAAATAQHHGYRACKRCRPDASPGSPEWNARADVVGRAMRLIADGFILNSASMGAPGVDEVNWLKPLRPSRGPYTATAPGSKSSQWSFCCGTATLLPRRVGLVTCPSWSLGAEPV